MKPHEALLAEFEQESMITKRFLERLEGKDLTWKPHEKSMTAGQLALHLAQSPGDIIHMAQQPQCPPPPGMDQPMPQPQSLAQVMAVFDKSVDTVKRLLSTFDEQKLVQTWSLVVDGQAIFSCPTAVVLRSFLLNHLYHHRGQLGVYLRLLGAKVPSSYGPSGDEAPEWMTSLHA